MTYTYSMPVCPDPHTYSIHHRHTHTIHTHQGLGHTLRSLASLQPPRPSPAFMDAFMRRVDETAAEMTYSDAVLLAGGEKEGGGNVHTTESKCAFVCVC